MFKMELLSVSWCITCLIGLTTILLYWFLTKDHGYWKMQGVPFVKPLPLLGSIIDIFWKPIHEIDLERHSKFGLIYGHFEGLKPLLSVGDPELLRDIFVKDFAIFSSRRVTDIGNAIFNKTLSLMKGDEEWKRIRTIITPTFTTGKIKRMLSIFRDCSKILVKNFKTLSLEGKRIDVMRLYGTYSMDVIASSAFSTKLDSHNDPNNEFVLTAQKLVTENINWRILMYLCFPSLMKFLKMETFPGSAIDFFKNTTLNIIKERKETGQVRNDFLQLVMDCAKDVADEQKDLPEKDDIASNYEVQEDINSQLFKADSSKNLSLDELVAQSVFFFLAGYHTTASIMAFATYLLALNPGIQDTLREEVDKIFKESKGELTYEGIQSMKYLDNVISETMRMYPPATRLDRRAGSDYKLGNTGITIKKDMCITVPVHAIHRDPKIYPHPDKFIPERFTPEERAKRNPYAFIPFGAGPRGCVAMRFALMEVKVCLAYVIANFHIKRCPETKVPLEFGKGQGLLIAKGTVLEMELRRDSPFEKREE